MVEPMVRLAPVSVRVREVVPPEMVKPSEAEVRVKPLIVPNPEKLGEPEPVRLPDKVNEGMVSPVVEIAPLIAGADRVLLVRKSVVVRPT